MFNNCKQALEVVLLHDRPGMPHISLSLTLIRLSTTNDTDVTTCFCIDRNINQTELVGLYIAESQVARPTVQWVGEHSPVMTDEVPVVGFENLHRQLYNEH